MDEWKRRMHHHLQQCHCVQWIVGQWWRLSGPSRAEFPWQPELYILRNYHGASRRVEDGKRRRLLVHRNLWVDVESLRRILYRRGLVQCSFNEHYDGHHRREHLLLEYEHYKRKRWQFL